MKTVHRLFTFLLIVSVVAYAQGNTWDKVRYNGGTLQTKVDAKDWHNQLTVNSDDITLKLKDGQVVAVPTKSVTGLSYGQEAHRRVGTMIALGILVAPLALFGLFHKTRLHFIGIEYTTAEGKKAGLLLQGDKENYRAILMALKGSTGAPLAVSEEDRKFVPTGIAATVVKGADNEKGPVSATPEFASTGSILVSLAAGEGEIYIDGAFVGNAPATLKVPPGKHTVKVVAPGFKEWQREITVSSGSELKLSPALEKI